MSIVTRLKVGAEILLSITIIIMIIVAIKVISLGSSIGTQLLLTTVFFVMFMWLGWIQPKATGIALIVLGSIMLLFFSNLASNPESWNLFGSPILVAGLLFLGAGWEFQQVI